MNANNIPISNKRRDLGGEQQCPARERDGSRCLAESGMWSYSHLCARHHRLLARGVKVVLVNGTRLDRIWAEATRLGEYTDA